MSLGADAYARQLQQLLPPGAAWNLEPGSRLSRLLRAIAEELARLDGRGETLLNEADPRTIDEMLVDWERALGLPDPCVGAGQTLAQRRAAVVARYTSVGGQAPAYYIAVALALGYTVTIKEFNPYDVDDDVESPLYGDDWAYAWEVNAPLHTVGEFSVDDPCEEPLAWWSNAALECVLNRLKPAHTILLFTYGTPAPEGAPRYMLLLALTSH